MIGKGASKMKRIAAIAAGIFLAPSLAFAMKTEPAPAAQSAAEAPTAIPVGDGKWTVSDGREAGRSRNKATLTYEAEAFPRLRLHQIALECEYLGGHRITVTGLVPAQSFPQPQVAMTVGEQSWSAVPNALYHARSAPVDTRMPANLPLDDNLRGANLSWPGHPPFADLSFFQRSSAPLHEAIRSGQPIRVAFNGQERVYPAVPADVATRYVERCGALSLPQLSGR